ncbi:MAG: hypothetical protein LBH10_00545 [Burkholderiaceae bacterium]|jgi:hypothetical protein|nr:hypothetical protein [Burkholderiaceae bacterium]
MPPLPCPQTREHNLIAFSLFGGNPKYCEVAVLNVQYQPHVYPHWVCRFYVDDSVPEHVIKRLRASGAQIVPVDGPAAQWPKAMWRFLALDDPQAHRVLFRDADSLISRREAEAVEQWLLSGKRFHTMRDHGAHTDLILAGMWGAVAGSLPLLNKLIQRFMSTFPITGIRYFADQDFLRQYVWPYARMSLMQHDSIFGFMDAVPFPDKEKPDIFHTVGYPVGGVSHDANVKGVFPDGLQVTWSLYRIKELNDGQPQEEVVCSYASTVQDGVVKMYIPLPYMQWLRQGMIHIRLTGYKAT